MIWLIKTILIVLLALWIVSMITTQSVWVSRNVLFTVLLVILIIKIL